MAIAATEPKNGGKKAMEKAQEFIEDAIGEDRDLLKAVFLLAAEKLVQNGQEVEWPLLDSDGDIFAFFTPVGARQISDCERRELNQRIEQLNL
ncbi:hypothetical protein [Roseimaritima sediminicola]|uniref:hypothetical protein n=1 Tax=Roseimaritima sediminicola TaxID=2662066 RepID=UPI0012982563|nr:hypothetical protein [Roseimaritima sediminicola]